MMHSSVKTISTGPRRGAGPLAPVWVWAFRWIKTSSLMQTFHRTEQPWQGKAVPLRNAGTKGEKKYCSYSFLTSALDESEWEDSVMSYGTTSGIGKHGECIRDQKTVTVQVSPCAPTPLFIVLSVGNPPVAWKGLQVRRQRLLVLAPRAPQM